MRLQKKLGEDNFNENTTKIIEQLTDKFRKTSEILKKINTETIINKNKALESLDDKLLEILNIRGVLSSYLLSLVSRITSPE